MEIWFAKGDPKSHGMAWVRNDLNDHLVKAPQSGFPVLGQVPGKCSRGCAVWPAQDQLLLSAAEDGGLGFFRIQDISLGKD